MTSRVVTSIDIYDRKKKQNKKTNPDKQRVDRNFEETERRTDQKDIQATR